MKTGSLLTRILMLTCLLTYMSFTVSLALTDSDAGTSDLTFARYEPLAYAVVVNQSTYDLPEWRAVADALLARYPSQLFIWNTSLYDVQSDIAAYQPTHIGFVCELTTANASFVQSSLWPFTRELDADRYGDAVWGIITGYSAADALRLVTDQGEIEIKTVLGGTTSCDLAYYTQGISTAEATYNRYYVKHSDSEATTEYNDGPTDRTEWLVTMIEDGIDLFDYDPVDIFYTSGHGNHNVWQMHYPTTGLEGYFRSTGGLVYGDPYSGPNLYIDSTNPKIYFGLGNCNIGEIVNSGSMAPAWIHRGGAFQYTGYVIPEGSYSHQHGGTKAYFYKVARSNTWAESYFLANQALRFDIVNNTPGANPPDLNGSALYGDPAMQMRMSHEGVYREPLFTSELFVNAGAVRDTATFRITMNREGSPGYTSKWGERHPAMILPFRAEEVEIISTDAMNTVVNDNFALMYIWYQGQAPLSEGATREVVFSYGSTVTGVDDGMPAELAGIVLHQNHPNPFNPRTKIAYSLPATSNVVLRIFDVDGHCVAKIVDEVQTAGEHSVVWEARDVPSGIYFYWIDADGKSASGKCVLLK